MKIAINAPTRHLQELADYRNNEYYLALAQRILSDKKYKNFYIKKSKEGKHVILDNGACELGVSIPIKNLLESVKMIAPSEVVIPDALDNYKKTLHLASEFLKDVNYAILKNLSLMAVVQGKTKSEWIDCYKVFSERTEITTIGISNTNAVYPNSEYEFSRVKTIELLVNRSLIKPNKKIHLLGLGNSGHQEIKLLKKYKFIQGVDSSAPVVHGAAGIRFTDGKYTKIRQYLPNDTELNNTQLIDIKHNIDILFDSAK